MGSSTAMKRRGLSRGGAAGWPRFTLLALAWTALGAGVAYFELGRAQADAIRTTDERLHGLARVAEAIVSADDARIHALMARLRVELRTRGDWSKPAALAAAEDESLRPARSIDNLLRRALEGMPELSAFELVVAGQDGLALARVEPGAGPPAMLGAAEREERARVLWYSDAVRAALEAGGRRVARSPVEQDAEAPEAAAITRVVIALHEDEEVVQGVLVGELDLAPLGTRLASLSTSELRVALVSPAGRVIGASSAQGLAAVPARFEAVPTGDAVENEADASIEAIVERDGLRSLLEPLSDPGDSTGALHVWLEAPAPPALAGWLLAGGWPFAFASLLGLVGAGWARDRASALGRGVNASRRDEPARVTQDESRERVAEAAPEPRAGERASIDVEVEASRVEEAERGGPAPTATPGSTSPSVDARTAGAGGGDAGAVDASAAAPAGMASATDTTGFESAADGAIFSERIILRDWLADVRGCLEREAASRGLTLVLRCDRALPREVELDPNWLGGLLIALGREALDATRASRVALDVYATEAAGLRFELDAGDTTLAAGSGMRTAALRLGAALDAPGRGRVAVEFPRMSA